MWFSTFPSSPYSFSFICRVFFEKSRIPIEELRHIWQLCDVTRDGALDIAEFTSAMHLVVLRRNNIPIPSALPSCLLPNLLYKTLNLPQNEPVVPEADLLHLESDNENDNAINKNTPSDYKRMSSSTYEGRGGLEATPKLGSELQAVEDLLQSLVNLQLCQKIIIHNIAWSLMIQQPLATRSTN